MMKIPLILPIICLFVLTCFIVYILLHPIQKPKYESTYQQLNAVISSSNDPGFVPFTKQKRLSVETPGITYLNSNINQFLHEIQENVNYVMKNRIPLPKLPDVLADFSHEDDSIDAQSNLRKKSIPPPPTYEEAVQMLAKLGFPSVEVDLSYQSLFEVLDAWNPDQIEIPSNFKERLYHFDYGNPVERGLSVLFRQAELPYKIFNVSSTIATSIKWNDQYLSDNIRKDHSLNNINVHTEESKDNHFLFWKLNGKSSPNDYTPPTRIIPNVNFDDYLIKTREAYNLQKNKGRNFSHRYYMIGAPPISSNPNNFISNDLKIFSLKTSTYFVTNPLKNKGIQCRISMPGVIAESHYDSGKNMVAMLRGGKRYVINPPRSCKKLSIIGSSRHPSFRHSIVDWSSPNQVEQWRGVDVPTIDTVVRTGEVLYIPSFWFHYIASLDFSIQCNTRSGFPENMIGNEEIKECFKHSK